MLAAVVLAATLANPAAKALAHYDKFEKKHLVPMVTHAITFQTDQYHPEAHAEQKAWLAQTAKEMRFVFRDAGKIAEIELPGPKGAPVLGLVIHGDVQPAEPDAWSFPPFGGSFADGYVQGRGSADDKGPLVQALLAMKALEQSGAKRTHTIRLLVGSEEESDAKEMAEYLAAHAAPDYSLVLDSEFPVVVGEKAWDGLALSTPLITRPGATLPYRVIKLDAGLSPSIVPDRAELTLRWVDGNADFKKLADELRAAPLPEGTRLVVKEEEDEPLLRVVAYGKSSHAGVNITGGRNALVALARVMEGKLPAGGADDLLSFARIAGQDIYGTGLGITGDDPVWGRYAVNVATIKPLEADPNTLVLYINLRRTPPRTAPESQAYLESFVKKFNERTGANLELVPDQIYFKDEPLGFRTDAKLVKRLMNVYARATGEKARPAISGGGTYAKRIPNAIAFGMWFPGKPYPGHDVDEKISVADLDRGTRVLIHALADIATGPRIVAPFAP